MKDVIKKQCKMAKHKLGSIHRKVLNLIKSLPTKSAIIRDGKLIEEKMNTPTEIKKSGTWEIFFSLKEKKWIKYSNEKTSNPK